MAARGELFTTQVYLDNRSYFFNVKENRGGDIFLQIVESKSKDGADFDRHQIAVFEEDMQKFLQGMDKSLSFIDKEKKNRAKLKAEKKQIKIVRNKSKESTKNQDDGLKRTGKVIHIKSKKEKSE
ncbi:MAG: DUF3276 family protein [Treponema sp.]|nr:DUF3276 family protein [Treponema sp.]